MNRTTLFVCFSTTALCLLTAESVAQADMDMWYDLFLVNVDGSGEKQLTFTAHEERSPDWSPDGKRIVFSQVDNLAILDLMTLEKSILLNVENLPRSRWTMANSPSWSPDGRLIAFTVSQGMPKVKEPTGIWTVRADGTRPAPLIESEEYESYEPTWSPDGNELAFVCTRDGSGDIFVADSSGAGLKNLSNTPSESERSPVWSPHGKHFLFVKGEEPNEQIYVMSASGAEVKNLSQSSTRDRDPAWSPDGTHIAFVRSTLYMPYDEPPAHPWSNVWVMNADGSGQVNLTNATQHESYASWSPDGKQIAVLRQHFMPKNDVIILHKNGGWELSRNPGDLAPLNYAEPQPDGTVKVRPTTPEEALTILGDTPENRRRLVRWRRKRAVRDLARDHPNPEGNGHPLNRRCGHSRSANGRRGISVRRLVR